MKHYNYRYLVVCMALLTLAACKKEQPVTLKADLSGNGHIPQNIQLVDYSYFTTTPYPDNYLRTGNYWIYESNLLHTDSVLVDGAWKTNEQGDTLFRLSHYDSRGSIFNTFEYLRITETGQLINELGQVVYSFAGLPQVSDVSHHRKGCGGWTWDNGHWEDTTVACAAGDYVFPSALFTITGHTEYCPFPGTKKTYVTRGVGLVRYEERTRMDMDYEQSIVIQLIRFKLAH